ncbi:Uncharacterised protein [Enterobacter hormaechei]|uniref:hypothetical protein n=1 Tax=Enterobacter hormaechei TaxID=158836 RepID=UPI0007915FB7|nr:hypothetical protein [Enterobacter hormaechei]CZW77128.1 Uncharacterised protein [Enterobacter hormaechei]CZY09262.1 Uncharacterised protein [Enterobacter hormaechei]
MSSVKIYTAISEDLSPLIDGEGFCTDMVRYSDYAALEAKYAALTAENAGLNEKMNKLATWPGIEFYSSAWEFNSGDGDTALEFMCDTKTPATDAYLAEVRVQARNELIDELEFRFTELSKTVESPELRSGAAGAAAFVSTFRKGASA